MDENTLRRNVYNKDKYPEYHVSDSKGVGRWLHTLKGN